MSNRALPLLPALLLANLLLASVLVAGPAEAAVADPDAQDAIDPGMCAQLADLPNAPMSVEACETLLRMGEDDPASHRPGDEAMDCAQIVAELRTMQGEGISTATATRTGAVVAEGQALGALHAAEMARQATPSPLALASSFLPNAVGAALMAPEQARTIAAMAQLQAADQRYSAQLGQHMDANAAELGAAIEQNPRLPRLTQLAMQQGCELPHE